MAALRASLFARGIERHPLFAALTAGALDGDAERRVALEIFHVVAAFPRFLSALLTAIEDWRLRMELVSNLFEEHGRMNPDHVHLVTYEHFLLALGVSEATIAAAEPDLPSLCYTRAVLDLCARQPIAEALGALAVIEEIVARVSPSVAAFGKMRAAGSGRSVGTHFGSHAVLDVTHANEIYAVALRLPPESFPAVERGMRLGMYYHRRLYDDLFAATPAPRPAEAGAGSGLPAAVRC
jgi:pyrroloquinoline-quinone synthase